MPRYKGNRIINNNSRFYRFLRDKRHVKNIRQYATAVLYNPSTADRASITTTAYTWGYGDRFYKLANQYYGDPEYWWVIAWWNGRPTEADITNGAVISIPIDLQSALEILGAY